MLINQSCRVVWRIVQDVYPVGLSHYLDRRRKALAKTCSHAERMT